MKKENDTVELAPRRGTIRKLLLEWSKQNFREFSWRKSREPYRILIAELLLKRTTATAVARMYDTFISAYPTIQDLIRASEEDLVCLLRPIGLYHQRAKGILNLSSHLYLHERTDIPDSYEELIAFPSIGAYSVRAILSFGFNKPAAVVDGNVRRILLRLYQDISPTIIKSRELQETADLLLPEKNHQAFNFAMLDLGSLICRPKPKCGVCPLTTCCDYYNNLPHS